MQFYRLTESRIKRVIRHPTRVEAGILEDAIACMQPAHGSRRGSVGTAGRLAGGARYSEIWTMYVMLADAVSSPCPSPLTQEGDPTTPLLKEFSSPLSSRTKGGARPHLNSRRYGKKIKIITAWRYPGRAPVRNPVPQNIFKEIKNLL